MNGRSVMFAVTHPFATVLSAVSLRSGVSDGGY